ncbi:phosphatase PAP2 family protein [Brevibacillus daliensis]|uniref:phosphatase PAP2 family protein n=1 Tax=Brevibacillus daliensis TaxID=2892995 RepID=UPI001E50C352|nr:phosphatase PAP2 family protein [Brevibacillus daliensis]
MHMDKGIESSGKKIYIIISLLCFIAFGLLATMVISNSATEWDRSIQEAVMEWRSPILTEILRWITYLGDEILLTWVSGLLAIVWWKKGRPVVLLYYLGTIAFGLLIKEIVKRSLTRERPEDINLILLPDSYSFPSGHAVFSSLVFGMGGYLLAKRCRRTGTKALWIIVALLIPFLVGYSRVYLGVHYPIDVLGGWLLATGSIMLSMYVYDKKCTKNMKRGEQNHS